jgi:magnesium-transporting ATPase (P-type)
MTEYLFFFVGKVLTILRNILWKHDFDDRYKDKHLIYAMYFPLIVTVVEAVEKDALENLPISELREWLLCFLTVVKNANRELLKSWLHKESNKRRIALFQALRYCAEAFEVCILIFHLYISFNIRKIFHLFVLNIFV